MSLKVVRYHRLLPGADGIPLTDEPRCGLCGSDDPKVRRMVAFGCGQKQDRECDGPFHEETKA